MSNSKSHFLQQREFMDAMGLKRFSLNSAMSEDKYKGIKLAESLVAEEVGELQEALAKWLAHPSFENLVEILDGAVDSVYVIYQLCNTMGLPFDAGFIEVQRSNMAKLQPDGTVRRREDGKVLKPEGWKPPNLWDILKTESDHEAYTAKQFGGDCWTARDFDKAREK